MSRPSFRPRPIDLNRPLQIIRSNKDFPVQEELFSTRGLPAVVTGVDPSEQEERHLKEALLASLRKDDRRKHEIEIPIPVVHERTGPIYEHQKPYHRPKEYIQEVKKDISLLLVLYEADEKDEAFVNQLNEKNEYQLSLSDFEYVMDTLERIQGSEMREGMKNLREIPEFIKEEIYQHWVFRRQEKEQPLLRILRKPPPVDDPNPALAFRPRDHEIGAQKGTENSYENYRKAVRMRRDFEKLRMIVEQVVKRERLKREHLSCCIVYSRLALASSSVKMAAVMKRSCTDDNNVLSIYDKRSGNSDGLNGASICIPLSGLSLPPDIRKAISGGRLGSHRSKKSKKRRRPEDVSTKDEQKEEDEKNANRFDEYGFDEAGQRFIKNMRYFSGGFVSSGVNPYDYRVFEAAALRNTARCSPWNLQTVQLPDDVPFCSPVSCPSSNGIRFRGRLGRGGRIIFDRVVDSSHGIGTPVDEGKERWLLSSSNSNLLPDDSVAVPCEKSRPSISTPQSNSVESMSLKWPSKKNGKCLENGRHSCEEREWSGYFIVASESGEKDWKKSSPSVKPDSWSWVSGI